MCVCGGGGGWVGVCGGVCAQALTRVKFVFLLGCRDMTFYTQLRAV